MREIAPESVVHAPPIISVVPRGSQAHDAIISWGCNHAESFGGQRPGHTDVRARNNAARHGALAARLLQIARQRLLYCCIDTSHTTLKKGEVMVVGTRNPWLTGWLTGFGEDMGIPKECIPVALGMRM